MNNQMKSSRPLPTWVLNKDPEALIARGREEYDPADPVGWYPGIALLIGREADVEKKITDFFRINGRHVSVEEYLRIRNGRIKGSSPADLVKLYVCAGRWEPLPPHKPCTGRDPIAQSWRLFSMILNAFVARDKKKIAAAIRKAEKEGWMFLPYAIVLEARKIGLDPKIKKYDF
jgi:hypothetical protein